MTYTQYKYIKASLEARANIAAIELNKYPKNALGLTEDASKDLRWKTLRAELNQARNDLHRHILAHKDYHRLDCDESRRARDEKRAKMITTIGENQ